MPVNHHPEWNRPRSTEDWDAEADQPVFSLSGSTIEERRTAYDVIEDYQNQLQDQATAVSVTAPTNRDLSGMSRAQKKNFKRAQKRREKKIAENGESGETDDDEETHELTAQEEEKRLNEIARQYAVPGRPVTSEAFVDWVSILNQYCQKNRINQPKYSEATNPFGGFGAAVVVTTERFYSATYCRTKKDAKHSAARTALLGLNIAVSRPDPCRAPHQRGGDAQRQQELEANREFLEQTIQENQRANQRVVPGFCPEGSFRPQNSSSNGVGMVTHQMAAVTFNQRQNADEEWHTVGRRPRDSGRGPGANNALRLAGRGRGRGFSR